MITFSVPKDLLLYSHEMGTPSDFSVRGFSGGQSEDGSSMTFRIMAEDGIELWTPAEITTALWLDAADSATITLNGSTVSQWADKSGNGRHATQGTAANQPARIIDGIQFDGVNDWMFSSLNFGQPMTYYVVCKTNVATGSTGSRQYVFDGNDTAGVERNLLALRGNQTNKPSIWAYSWLAHTASTSTSVTMYSCRFNGASSSIGVNASAVSGNAGSYVNSSGLVIGANHLKNSDFLNGVEYEIVAVATQSTLIEGYLAHKWDALLGVTTLVSALPSDHPYKSAAPTM